MSGDATHRLQRHGGRPNCQTSGSSLGRDLRQRRNSRFDPRRARPSRRDSDLRSAELEAAGCLLYEVGINDEHPDTVFVAELWTPPTHISVHWSWRVCKPPFTKHGPSSPARWAAFASKSSARRCGTERRVSTGQPLGRCSWSGPDTGLARAAGCAGAVRRHRARPEPGATSSPTGRRPEPKGTSVGTE